MLDAFAGDEGIIAIQKAKEKPSRIIPELDSGGVLNVDDKSIWEVINDHRRYVNLFICIN